eukprot:329904_1
MAITTSQAIFSMGSADVEKLLNMSLDDLVRDRRKAKQMNQKALKSKSSKTTSEAKSKGTAKAKRMAAIANKRGMKPDSKPTPMDVDNQIKMVQSKLLDEHVKATKMVASKKKRTSKRRQALKLVNEASKNANVAKSQATKKGLKRANKPPKAPAKQVGKESSKKKLTKGPFASGKTIIFQLPGAGGHIQSTFNAPLKSKPKPTNQSANGLKGRKARTGPNARTNSKAAKSPVNQMKRKNIKDVLVERGGTTAKRAAKAKKRNKAGRSKSISVKRQAGLGQN